jgi:Cu/Ag efflux protein CusF
MLTPISPLLRRTLALTSLACTAFITLGTAVSAHAEPVKGEVIKVMASQQKLTLRHEAIPSLDMPPMTMNYRVAKPELLSGVKAGDKVIFEAEDRQGNFTVTQLKVQP